jgi:hypothetical protein
MNLRLSIGEKLLARARALAHERGRSVNRLIRGYLKRLTGSSADVMAQLERLWKEHEGRSGGWKWNRDDVYDRPVLGRRSSRVSIWPGLRWWHAVVSSASDGSALPATGLLAEVVRRIVEVARPERIILFGSAARGDAGPDSDLDLLVVKRGVEHRRRLAQRIYRRLLGVEVPVGPALREGREVYVA